MKYHYSSLLCAVLSSREFHFGIYNTDINTHKLSSEVYGAINLLITN